MSRISSIQITWLLCILFAACSASSLRAFTLDQVTVTVIGGGSENITSELKHSTPRLLDEIKTQTGLGYTGDVSLVVCTTRESFRGYYARFADHGRDEVLGVAIPSQSSIALNLALIREVSSRPETVYKHELCHLVLADNINYPGLLRPLWFEEGLAQWVSETAYESAHSAVQHAKGLGRDPESLSDISAMASGGEDMADGYRHAVAALENIIQRHGEDGLRKLIAALSEASAQPQPPRFEQVYGETFAESFGAWEREFVASRKRMSVTRILLFAGSNAFALSMLIAVLLAVVALRRKRKKERAMVEMWEEQDAYFPPDPSWAAAEEPERGVDQIVQETLDSPEPDPIKPSHELDAATPDDDGWELGEDGWVRTER